MENLINMIFPRSKASQAIYDLAMKSTNATASLFKLYKEGDIDIPTDENLFVKIFPNDPKSPAIYWVDKNQYIIRYPPHSKPYSHSFDDKCKFIECLSGKLFDANSNMKIFNGDKIKVHPKDNFAPYTMDESCYLRICVGACNSSFDQVCK
jgi:hypothetical protein